MGEKKSEAIMKQNSSQNVSNPNNIARIQHLEEKLAEKDTDITQLKDAVAKLTI